MVQREQKCLQISKLALSPISSKHFQLLLCPKPASALGTDSCFFYLSKGESNVQSNFCCLRPTQKPPFTIPGPFFLLPGRESQTQKHHLGYLSHPTIQSSSCRYFPVFSLCLLLILSTFSKSCYSACGVLPCPFQKLIFQIGCHPCQQNRDTFTYIYSLLH